jgi:hypothetical protein
MGGGAAAASTRGTYGETNWRAEEEYREGVREFSDTGASGRGRGEGGASGARAMNEEEGAGSARGEAEEESEW